MKKDMYRKVILLIVTTISLVLLYSCKETSDNVMEPLLGIEWFSSYDNVTIINEDILKVDSFLTVLFLSKKSSKTVCKVSVRCYIISLLRLKRGCREVDNVPASAECCEKRF